VGRNLWGREIRSGLRSGSSHPDAVALDAARILRTTVSALAARADRTSLDSLALDPSKIVRASVAGSESSVARFDMVLLSGPGDAASTGVALSSDPPESGSTTHKTLAWARDQNRRRQLGTVTFYDPGRGYGFIRVNSYLGRDADVVRASGRGPRRDVFFHRRGVFDPEPPGDRDVVSFYVVRDEVATGKFRAEGVTRDLPDGRHPRGLLPEDLRTLELECQTADPPG